MPSSQASSSSLASKARERLVAASSSADRDILPRSSAKDSKKSPPPLSGDALHSERAAMAEGFAGLPQMWKECNYRRKTLSHEEPYTFDRPSHRLDGSQLYCGSYPGQPGVTIVHQRVLLSSRGPKSLTDPAAATPDASQNPLHVRKLSWGSNTPSVEAKSPVARRDPELAATNMALAHQRSRETLEAQSEDDWVPIPPRRCNSADPRMQVCSSENPLAYPGKFTFWRPGQPVPVSANLAKPPPSTASTGASVRSSAKLSAENLEVLSKSSHSSQSQGGSRGRKHKRSRDGSSRSPSARSVRSESARSASSRHSQISSRKNVGSARCSSLGSGRQPVGAVPKGESRGEQFGEIMYLYKETDGRLRRPSPFPVQSTYQSLFPDPNACPQVPELQLDLASPDGSAILYRMSPNKVPAAGQTGLGGSPIAGTSFVVNSVGTPFSKRALNEMSYQRNQHENVYLDRGLWDAASTDRRRHRWGA